MNKIKEWICDNAYLMLLIFLFVVGLVAGSLLTTAWHDSKIVIIKDPVMLYSNGTTMVVNHEGEFSYSGAVGIISQEQLLQKLDIKGDE